ncbi:MAG: M15 family metallopeptidase [Actinomycetota bacterium]
MARSTTPMFAALVLCAMLAAPAHAGTQPPYRSSVERLDAEAKASMRGVSWHRGCPVPLRALRAVHVSFWRFDRTARMGTLIVHRRWAEDMRALFRRLYRDRFPIRRMRPVDVYDGDDHRSMAADNTSGFNCRFVAGTTRWSQHAYGRAIDIDPVENPYVSGDHVTPKAGWRFVDRSLHRRGMIHRLDVVWRAFHRIGWGWGGTWRTAQDYQHFSATGT